MDYMEIDGIDRKVSRLALGTYVFSGQAAPIFGRQEEKDSIATIECAIEAGINFFDTAERYVQAEGILGRALGARRKEVVIASKAAVTNLARNDIVRACEDSLAHLGTDYIDLYQIHWANHDITLEETIEGLDSLLQAGKILAVGVCNHGVKDIARIAPYHRAVTNQLPYSLIWRAIEYTILPSCIESEIGVLVYSPLSHGLLSGRFRSLADIPRERMRTRFFSKRRSETRHNEPGCEEQLFVALDKIRSFCADRRIAMSTAAITWLLHQGGVSSVILGARNPDQLRENVSAAETRFSADELSLLADFTEPLKRMLGDNPDMWENAANSRIA